MKHWLVRVTTLAFFLSAISVFVAYRGGFFSHEDGDVIAISSAVPVATQDSIPARDSLEIEAAPHIMSSSKVIILRSPADSGVRRELLKSHPDRERLLMYSSKAGPIVSERTPVMALDSVLLDSLRRRP